MSESIKVVDRSSLHHYRTEIPNIIFSLGLDPYEFTLYAALKKTAGDAGQCVKSIKTLASEVGCSETKLKEAKKSLCQSRPQLGGISLIEAYARTAINGDPDTDMIEINDIWPINFELSSSKEKFRGGSPQNPGVGRHKTQGGSPGDHKEEPIKEEQNNNKTVAVSSDSEIPKWKPGVKIFECLKTLDIPDSDKIQISSRPNETKERVEYVVKWAMHPTTKINKSVAQAIKWALNESKLPEMPKTQEDVSIENRRIASDFKATCEESSMAYFEILMLNVEIGYKSSQMPPTVIAYTENGFREQLRNALIKYQFKVKK